MGLAVSRSRALEIMISMRTTTATPLSSPPMVTS